jgi:cytidylate kinase
VAASLGYELLDQEIFREAASASDVPEDKLLSAFREPPGFFGMSSAVRKRSIAHVSAALVKHLLKDNVVYHGPFGHLLVPGVSHVLKVRIVAQREDRVATKIKRETNLSETDADKALLREDKQRSTLAKQVFGVDDEDTDPFDLIINTSQVDVDTAAEIIVNTVKRDRYQPMTYSMRCMERLELALRTRASLVGIDPNVEVQVESDHLRIQTRLRSDGKQRTMREKAAELEGVQKVEMEVLEDSLSRY